MLGRHWVWLGLGTALVSLNVMFLVIRSDQQTIALTMVGLMTFQVIAIIVDTVVMSKLLHETFDEDGNRRGTHKIATR
jgi:hypothetical protein